MLCASDVTIPNKSPSPLNSKSFSDIEPLRQYLDALFGKDLSVFVSGHKFCEITNKVVSKALGVEFLHKFLNIDFKNMASIGDAENDLSMSELLSRNGGMSIAMGNGVQKMKDICIKLSNKIKSNINSLIFLYGGNQLNLDKTFNEITKENKINILVYKNENEICIKCGRILNNKIIDDIILLNNNINYTLIGLKSQIDNIMNDLINKKDIMYINSQLKNINIVINNINEDIKKNNELLNSLLRAIKETNNVFNNFKNKNVIRATLDIKANESDNIILFNTDINNGIDVYLNNKKVYL